MFKQINYRGLLWLLLAAAVFTCPLAGQEYRATITGTVTDATGAVVPNAQVTARNIATSATASANTNEAGLYTIPFLVPGTYKLTATANGFKQTVRDGVELHATDRLQADLKMEIGGTTESVTVVAESEQLRAATASMAQTINMTEARDLPNMGRNTYMMASLTTGMFSGATTGQASSTERPYDGAASQMNHEGLYAAYQITLNGIPNAPSERASAAIYTGFVPSPDAVEEVTVQTHAYDAQYGHSSGAAVNAVLKGGTNKLHGSVYEFFRNDKLNANNFSANRAGQKRGVMRWNQPGFVIDGPVFLPKLYNGKDKTFFMFSMEWIRNASPLPYTASFPTQEEHTGDFSNLVTSNGAPVIIYDPSTVSLIGGKNIRQPFANNKIPTSRINPIGQKLLDSYPMPNVAGTAYGMNNFTASPNSQQDKYRSIASRVDHQINERNRLTFTGFSNKRNQVFPNYGFSNPEASPGYLHYRNNHGGGADWVYTMGPTTVLDVKYGFIYHPFAVALYGDGMDLTKLGFSSSFIAQLPHTNFPGVDAGGYTGLVNYAGTGTAQASQYTTTFNQTLSAILNKSLGRHNLKTGGEVYVMKANNNTPVSNLNPLRFNAGFTQQDALTGSATAGNSWATMLLGYPFSGGVSNNIASAFEQIYTGFFVQDDWRITDRLTLNLGLRWEYESPMTERYDRQNAGFAFNTASPLQASVTGLSLKGGLLFTDSKNRLPFKKDLNNWAPRLGAAYRLTNRTVIRGGFGLNYPVTFQTGNSTGFSQSTGYVPSTDGNITPATGLSNLFPSGVLLPTGSSLGLMTAVGQGYSFADPERTIPKIYSYSLAIQHQLPGSTLVEIAYAGNYATQLSVSKAINALPASFYALPGNPIPVPVATLTGKVTNPMAGLIPSNSSLNGSTITYSSLQVPYPQFTGISESTRPIGKSFYSSMQASVEKRLTHGLQGRVSFTWSKVMQETEYLNDQDDWNKIPRRQGNEPSKLLTISSTYELPIFKQTRGFLHNVLGGWEANGTMRYINGYLIGAPSGSYSSGVNPKLDNPTYNQWFNTCSVNTSGVRQNCASASQPVAWIQTPNYTLRTLSTYVPGIRTEVPVLVDFAMFKSFRLHESVKAQFRATAYNLANTPSFGNVNTTFGNAGFGQVGTGQSNDPRIVELALKLNF